MEIRTTKRSYSRKNQMAALSGNRLFIEGVDVILRKRILFINPAPIGIVS